MLILKENLLYFSIHQKLLTYKLELESTTEKKEMSDLDRVKAELYGDDSCLVKVDEYEYSHKITAMISMKHKLIIGTEKGYVFFDKQHVIALDAQISALFFNDPFFIVATTAGLLQIYNKKHLCFQFWHRSPINQVTFTNVIYIQDGSNRLVLIEPVLSTGPLLPSASGDAFRSDTRTVSNQKKKEEQFDNLNYPFKVHDKCIFITDDSVLYAKTANNFSSLLKLDGKVEDFTFSTNGGILFILEERKIKVIDFNTRDILREIRVFNCKSGKILYFKNALLYSNEKLNLIRDVLSVEEQKAKMKEIVLEENRFYVRKRVETFISDSEDEDLKNLFKYKERKDEEFSDEGVSAEKEDFAENYDTTAEKKDYLENYDTITTKKEVGVESLARVAGSIQEGSVILLSYNETGFLLCKQDVSVNLIELVFHDHMISNKVIHCRNKSTMGSFDQKGVLLGTETLLTYYEDEKEWDLDISTIQGLTNKKIKLLRISRLLYVLVENISHDSMVVLHRNGTTKDIYDLPQADTFVVKNEMLLVLASNRLLIFDEESSCVCDLIGQVNFLTIGAERQIYYANANYIYKLDRFLSRRLLTHANKTILCFHDDNFIVLNKLVPVPDVEYLKVEEKAEPKIPCEDTKQERMSQSSYNRFENVPKRTRKYNPLQKN